MTKVHLLGATALRGIAAATLIAGFGSTAYAQEVEQEKQQEAQAPGAPTTEQETESNTTASTDQDIVVTGSRIRRPNLESTVPVTSVGGEEFFETGNVSVGDALNDLPALRSTLGQSNSTQFLGTSGLNLLDLRGLGTQRTLVLVNGRRHVPGDILYNANSPDVNTIPTDLIERVDVVTGGNSAIYGSDAIAGVVNFVLKKDYNGLQIRGQGGISKYGDAGAYYTSLLAGKNFADGRGNVAINLEYARQNDYYASGRPNLRQNNGFVTVDTDIRCRTTAPRDPANCDPAVNEQNSDGNPDAVFYRDIRSTFYSNGGTFVSYLGGNQYAPFLFQPDGTLVQQTGTIVGLPFQGSFIGGNGDNFRDGTQFGLSPKLDRYSANLVAHFEISPALEPFVEAKFSRTDSLGNASGPFFTGAVGEKFSSQNPYLTNQARDIIGAYYSIYGDYYDAAGNPGANGVPDARELDYGFSLYKNAVDLGNREEKGRRDTYRIVTGIRGDLGSNLNYELSVNYGEHREKTQITGNVNLQRYLLAIDAVRDGSGNIVCRAKLDPTSASAFVDSAFARQQLVNDIATCVPVNLFGSGNITQQARDYLLTNSRARAKLTQLDITGFVSGDTGTFFNLPGGPVGFALGGEYRRETAFYDQDDFTQSGLTFYNGIATWKSPKFKVKEAFGELRFPILKNTPFFEELTLSAAGRVSDYKGRTGTVFAYNAGLDWAPVRDIRFRANYSRAVRAPNLSDLSFPLSQNYATVSDPCSTANRNGAANRDANCTAAGIPSTFNYVYRSSLAFQSGGNPNLREEKSDSYTVGAVIQPRFLPGFSASVDYYDITVNNVITSLSAQAILNACYDQANINNQFCGQFQRYGPAGGPQGQEPFRIIENSLQVVPLNFAKLKVRGIDVEVAYRREIGNLGRLNTRLIYTRALENASFLNPTDPGFGNTANGELGNPKNAFNWKTSLEHGPFTLGYEMRYLDKMTIGAYENYFSYQGRPPQNADAFEKRFYPATFYHDVRLAIDAGKKFNFYVGVDNLLNTNPPLGLSGIGDGSGIYSNRGRYFYSGFVAKF